MLLMPGGRVLGIGTDLLDIRRIADSIERFGDALARRTLHEHEQALYASQLQPARWLAKRFAAKEAVAKALGTGFAQGVSARRIEVVHSPAGQPGVVLHGPARQRADQLGAGTCLLSLSDERDWVVAFAVLLAEEAADRGQT